MARKTPTIDELKKSFTDGLQASLSVNLANTPAMLYYEALLLALDNVKHDGKPLPEGFRKAVLSSDYTELNFLGADASAHKLWLRSLAMLHVRSFTRVLDCLDSDVDVEIMVARLREIQVPVK